MATKKLVIEIEFDEDIEEDYTSLEFSSMRVLDEKSTLTLKDRDQIAEHWSQSDWYSIGFVSAFIGLVGGESRIEAKDVRSY